MFASVAVAQPQFGNPSPTAGKVNVAKSQRFERIQALDRPV
jgi:hypothetical protein